MRDPTAVRRDGLEAGPTNPRESRALEADPKAPLPVDEQLPDRAGKCVFLVAVERDEARPVVRPEGALPAYGFGAVPTGVFGEERRQRGIPDAPVVVVLDAEKLAAIDADVEHRPSRVGQRTTGLREADQRVDRRRDHALTVVDHPVGTTGIDVHDPRLVDPPGAAVGGHPQRVPGLQDLHDPAEIPCRLVESPAIEAQHATRLRRDPEVLRTRGLQVDQASIP